VKIIKLIWNNTYGLLVDDGSMAAGALIIIAITGVLSQLAPDETARNMSGFLMLALVCALVLTNLFSAGRNAARQRQVSLEGKQE
jgi:hypothetical protein